MQLKGLVRFFTILLIAYSLYQLSFTWFVKNHEKKMSTRAKSYVRVNYPSALEKYPGNKDSQAIYQEVIDRAYQERLKRLLDSTKDVTVTYSFTGPVSYQKAKEEELNLGLDLQGGMNVTLEVEMTGLLRSLANNSKDPNFLAALRNAERRKANSNADFITLFVEEYRKIEQTRPLASLFAGASSNKINVKSSDGQVESYIRGEARDAFDRTFRVLRTRIDQFGVAQPNINPNRDKAIINVELPGVQDKDRVRKILQSTANLQFWEVYTLEDPNYANGWQKAIDAFAVKMGANPKKDSVTANDTSNKSAVAKTDTTSVGKGDTSKEAKLAQQLGLDQSTNDTGKTATPQIASTVGATLDRYIQFMSPSRDEAGKVFYPAAIGSVAIKDTALVRGFLNELSANFPSDAVFAYGIPARNKNNKLENRVPLLALKTFGRAKAKLEGDAISDAGVDYDQFGKLEIIMNMKNFGSTIWAKMTGDNLNKPIAIVLDNIVYSSPNVISAITGGRSTITGTYTQEEALDLANILKAGKLPAPAKIVQEQQVGPTLGKKAIQGGSMAFLISFIVIFALMLVYYNTSGLIANIALILNLLFTVGILSGLGATLTAPGIAGLVLTIGMAVDTNVIIYERIKEELSKGKGYLPAIAEGYKRSLPPVLDAHVTTILTAVILFYFGLGPVKGFATTQIIGILLSLFCGILVSRWVSELFTNKKKHLEYFTKVSRRIFKHAKFKFIEYRKVAYVISFVVLALGIASFFHGFEEGVEFKGGRSFTVQFDKAVNVEKVRDDLKVALGSNAVIKTVGDNSRLDITTSYLINDTRTEADSLVEVKLMEGLKTHLPPSITFDEFRQEKYLAQIKKVLPTISDDLKKGAIKAIVFGLLAIFLYIFIRFRDWRYSLGTIVALLHDVFVTLIVFSFVRDSLGFPLEIDQHFIAAILTVIGFSMNDTVIVFDRIREDSRLMPTAPRGEVINRAINETLSRTVMTSLTVFLTILILFLVGGEVTRGFAFAMLIGVVTGTYSSIFVAAPILVDLGGKRALGKSAAEDAREKKKFQVKAETQG